METTVRPRGSVSYGSQNKLRETYVA
jgi:hypothetical protein